MCYHCIISLGLTCFKRKTYKRNMLYSLSCKYKSFFCSLNLKSTNIFVTSVKAQYMIFKLCLQFRSYDFSSKEITVLAQF